MCTCQRFKRTYIMQIAQDKRWQCNWSTHTIRSILYVRLLPPFLCNHPYGAQSTHLSSANTHTSSWSQLTTVPFNNHFTQLHLFLMSSPLSPQFFWCERMNEWNKKPKGKISVPELGIGWTNNEKVDHYSTLLHCKCSFLGVHVRFI